MKTSDTVPTSEIVNSVEIKLPWGSRGLGRVRYDAIDRLISAGSLTWSELLPFKGTAKEYAGRYRDALESVVEVNPDLFEAAIAGPHGAQGLRFHRPVAN